MPHLIDINEENASIRPALILIPDISGFTEYFEKSENMHCRYIIADLLEVILNSNLLDLQVSELEGDAVLFYRFSKPPKLEEIVDQCQKTFNSFHKYLKQFENDKLCDCECCSKASNLSLKFIVHYGKVSPVTIQNRQKLFGRDVIISHKLLKNNIKLKEYILVSETYVQTQEENELNKILDKYHFELGSIEYKYIGQLDYHYLNLEEYKKNITSDSLPKLPELNKTNLKYKIYIDAPVNFVWGIITNFKFKPNWITVLQNINYNERAIPRISAIHKCAVSDIFFKTAIIDYQSVYINELKTNYVEKLSNFKNIDVYLSYNLKSKGLGTLLVLELYFKNRGVYSLLLKYLLGRKSSRRKIKNSLKKLKSLCEGIYNKYFN